MKHTMRITMLLVVMFFFSQLIGLAILSNTIHVQATPSGEQEILYEETIVGPRPETEGFGSFLLLMIAVGIGTGLILVIMMLKYSNIIWKLLFLYAVFITIAIALGVFIAPEAAFIIALGLAILKVFRPHPITHNVTEVFMYAGIAVLLVPIFNLLWIIILLLAISAYDFIAVFKVKHMIKMAKFQTQSRVFAGLSFEYTRNKKIKKTASKINVKSSDGHTERVNAILGGGDMAFPLLFAGVAMQFFVLSGSSLQLAFLKTIIISLVTTISLFVLFLKSEKGKFYPAMPVLTAGSLIGLVLAWLV
jgi:presenilin-like A22 family membrane protease